MQYVIQLIAIGNYQDSPFDGQYLKEYDPNKRGKDPMGHDMFAHVVTTPSLEDAMKFPNQMDAWQFWRQPSTRWPIRPHDGMPNRPLTAFTISVMPAND